MKNEFEKVNELLSPVIRRARTHVVLNAILNNEKGPHPVEGSSLPVVPPFITKEMARDAEAVLAGYQNHASKR